ncbi:putative protein OS=Streptomyces aurantiogriseus OX=66870 GN=GCM10010251_47230 PE=4 SV=1 [Streptomyces aurantiogriseus]|uniref:Uncharacterized protein n=2 Tax=Streptomyces aurantiogriseus TaxID=66870 RepID=A0A918FDV3_9ACTN|nr:hypothetical protein GCM10010251_47230 [Streptomyces aurantiogriseus]
MGSTVPPFPRLDFRGWCIVLPERGRRFLLPAENLREPLNADVSERKSGLWVLRTESGLGVLVPDGMDVIRNGTAITGMAVLHQGDTLEFGGRLAVYEEVQRLTLDPDDALTGRHCPHCFTTFTAGTGVVRCPLCGEGYCPDCWEHLVGSRCCSRNCHFSPDSQGTHDQ